MMTGSSELSHSPECEEYFRELETLLLDLHFLRDKVSKEMQGLSREYRTSFRRSRLILYEKKREPESRPYGLYWAKLCRPPATLPEIPPSGSRGTWKIHVSRRRLDHDLIYLLAREAKREGLLWEFERRALALNGAYRAVQRALVGIEQRFLTRTEPRRWESGTIDVDAPPVSPDLRPESRRALGAAWPLLLRMGAVEVELVQMAGRYNAGPAFEGFRMSFGRDEDHPYGRLSWLHWGGRLPRLNELENARENLTDVVLRRLHLPESVRRAIARHELHRRQMTRLHRRYTGLLGEVKRLARKALAAADAGLQAARPRLQGAG